MKGRKNVHRTMERFEKAKKEGRRAAQWRRRREKKWWRRKKGSRSKIKTEGREMCDMLKGKADEVMQRRVEERK